MGNVNMEAKQIHDRTETGKHQSVADHLKALDAIAKQIENLPTFTSNDRAFLEELPAFPIVDGRKVLTATTESGDTSLSYDEIQNELPADPVADGVKVLTATTTSGETVLSWEEPESGVVDYSTTEQNTGRKWIDGKDIYSKVIDFESNITIPNNTLYDTELDYSFVETLISAGGVYVASDGTSFWNVNANIAASGHLRLQGCRLDNHASARYVYLEYTKATV